MLSYKTNQTYSTTSSVAPVGGVVAAGVAGAVLAGSMAAAKEIRNVQSGKADKAEAVSAVAKEALGSGLATAAGALAAKTVFRSGPLALLTLVAASIGVKYAYDGFVSKKVAVKTAPAKAATKTSKTK